MLKSVLMVALVMMMGISTAAAQDQQPQPLDCDPYHMGQSTFLVQPSDLTAPASDPADAVVMQDLGGFNPQALLSLASSIGEVPRNIASNANPATQLAPARYALVTPDGNQLKVYEGTCTESAVLGELAQGTRVTVLDGPLAGEGLAWWRVRMTGLTGWVIEGEDGEIWLHGA